MNAAVATPKPGGKGFLYFAALFLLGLAANLIGLYGGYWLGLQLNKVLVGLGVSFGEYSWMILPFFLAIMFWGIAAATVIGSSVTRVGQFMGGHMFVTVLLAFTTIIGVNLALAYNAVATFPGLEVKNSYVASQEFNKRKAAQEALGWDVSASAEDGILRLVMNGPDGAPVYPTEMEAILGRATQIKDDQVLEFTHDGTAFVAPVTLARGNWNIRMTATAEDGTLYSRRLVLHVKK